MCDKNTTYYILIIRFCLFFFIKQYLPQKKNMVVGNNKVRPRRDKWRLGRTSLSPFFIKQHSRITENSH